MVSSNHKCKKSFDRHQICKDDVCVVAGDIEAGTESPAVDGQVNKQFHKGNLLIL
jgi:hypothetical protein